MPKTKYKTIRYRRGPHHISVRVPREKVSNRCAICGNEFREKGYSRLNTHHWREKYNFDKVKEKKIRVLDNSVQLDVNHHRVANAMREITDYIQNEHITIEQVAKLVKTMPEDMKTVWIKLAQEISWW
ncbi:hypothetical protein AKJ59_00655 [candidate division MSBL1 archaeon SCGC-AAA385M02]|uniref:Uncharacterized protein n=1 Tax=candidate division MSBL1 archaeon SCGC-AAA385M02 TaxID=1698287 RepID=A0A133VQE4_9EURY|nr:hypothetical protein AKJ59_00655 [candidate division MSBL1 archaeon SCGC-AAA385M02]